MTWFRRSGLRVLMYHKTSASTADELTVTVAQLEAQMRWLRDEGYAFTALPDVIRTMNQRQPLPAKAVLVTFDDAYRDTLDLAKPVLDRVGVRAAVFVPTAYVGQESGWDQNPRPVMSAAELRRLAAAGWDLGFHSHRHRNFALLTGAEIAAEVRDNLAAFRELELPWQPALAYPYGGRPEAPAVTQAMREVFERAGVQLAFRIGNRVNAWPLKRPLEVNRLIVRGDRDFRAFCRTVRWGRLL